MFYRKVNKIEDAKIMVSANLVKRYGKYKVILLLNRIECLGK